MKLRAIILVLAVLAFIATAAGGFLFYSSLEREINDVAGVRADELIADISKDIDLHISEHVRVLRFISGEDEITGLFKRKAPKALETANLFIDRVFKSLEVMDVCYIMDSEGSTVVSSNRSTPGSFVGKNYSFRPYFKEAVNGHPFVYAAYGVTSKKRGLYYSYPVYADKDELPSGVLVLKENIEHLNSMINRPYEGVMMITGPHGIIFFSNRGEWLFGSLWKLSSEEEARVSESRQFGKGPWEWTGIEEHGGGNVSDIDGKMYHLHKKGIASLPGWNVVYLHDHEMIIASIGSSILKRTSIMVLVFSLLMFILVAYLYRMANIDISLRKKAENALNKSEEKFRAYFEKAPTGYQSLDENGCFIDVNEAWLKALQYDRDEVIGRSFADFLAPGYAGKFRENFPCFKESGEILGIEFKMVRKDGSVVIMAINGKIGYNSEGDFQQTHCLLNDITERKQFEEERERLNDQLKERNTELQQILYTVSHDLRSPLINIQGYSKILEKAVQKAVSFFEGEDISEDIKKKINAIIEDDISESNEYIILSIRKMDSLLAGLLKLSRTVRADLKIEEIEMKNLISDVVKTFDIQIKAAGALVEVFDLPSCYGDGVQVNQVFSNLIGNALKFLSSERKGLIKVSGHKEEGQSVYCVEDNGIGIPTQEQEKIFEMFHQTAPEAGGSEGLGLSIVKKILQRHGGKVWVESEEGKGSKFFVALPQKIITN